MTLYLGLNICPPSCQPGRRGRQRSPKNRFDLVKGQLDLFHIYRLHAEPLLQGKILLFMVYFIDYSECFYIKIIPMLNREPLSYADYALLRFDSPDNWMIITALLTFETRLGLEVLTGVVQHLVLQQRRFRQRVVQPRIPRGRAYWEDVENFNSSQHITPVRTPLPADPKLLEELVSRVMSVGLDFSHPLWHFYLVERYGEASALVMRFHHCLADGVSLMNVLSSITQERPVEPANAFTKPGFDPNSAQHSGSTGNKSGAKTNLGRLVGTSIHILGNANDREDIIRWGSNMVSAIGSLVFSPPDTNHLLRGPIGESKRATWSPPVSLKQIKFIGDVFEGTVNDVLLSAVVGALRRYILQADGDPTPPEIHGLVPVDMRRDSRLTPLHPFIAEKINQSMGNQVGAALLNLPVEIEDPIIRLAVIHNSMTLLKASGEAAATNWLMNLLGVVPEGIHDFAVRFWATKSSAIVTNVVGPGKQLYLGSSAIETMIGWVPNFGPAGLGVSFISYNGNVRLGVAVDLDLFPDPERIVNYFLEEINLLMLRAPHSRQSS